MWKIVRFYFIFFFFFNFQLTIIIEKKDFFKK